MTTHNNVLFTYNNYSVNRRSLTNILEKSKPKVNFVLKLFELKFSGNQEHKILCYRTKQLQTSLSVSEITVADEKSDIFHRRRS